MKVDICRIMGALPMKFFSNVSVYCPGCERANPVGGYVLGTEIGHDIPLWILAFIYAKHHEFKHRREAIVGGSSLLEHKTGIHFKNKE